MNALPLGRAASIRCRYAKAAAASSTGGTRFGITTAREKARAVAGTVSFNRAPSRRCRCQSSGVVSCNSVMSPPAGNAPCVPEQHQHSCPSGVAKAIRPHGGARAMPHHRNVTKLASSSIPCSLRMLSGWNCTPTMGSWRCRNPMISDTWV